MRNPNLGILLLLSWLLWQELHMTIYAPTVNKSETWRIEDAFPTKAECQRALTEKVGYHMSQQGPTVRRRQLGNDTIWTTVYGDDGTLVTFARQRLHCLPADFDPRPGR